MKTGTLKTGTLSGNDHAEVDRKGFGIKEDYFYVFHFNFSENLCLYLVYDNYNQGQRSSEDKF